MTWRAARGAVMRHKTGSARGAADPGWSL